MNLVDFFRDFFSFTGEGVVDLDFCSCFGGKIIVWISFDRTVLLENVLQRYFVEHTDGIPARIRGKKFWKLRRLASQKGRSETRIELEAHRFAALPALKPGSPGSAP